MKLEKKWPGYADLLTDDLLASIGSNRAPGVGCRTPPPSQVFLGLKSSLDRPLARAGLDRNVALCSTLAGLKESEQSEFFALYLKDPDDARHWASLPRWKRPIRKGDAQDDLIWRFVFILRTNQEALADGRAASMKVQGGQLGRFAGCLRRITDPERLFSVLTAYGDMLEKEQDLGDTLVPPWRTRMVQGLPAAFVESVMEGLAEARAGLAVPYTPGKNV